MLSCIIPLILSYPNTREYKEIVTDQLHGEHGKHGERPVTRPDPTVRVKCWKVAHWDP